MRSLILISFLLGAFVSSMAQQTSMRTQHYFNIASVNSAYMGSQNALVASVGHREQWAGIDGAPQRSELIAHTPLGKGRVGVGMNIIRESVGAHTRTGFRGTYVYRLPLFKGSLGMGVSLGANYFAFEWQDIDYEQEGDAIPAMSNPATWTPLFNASLLYNTERGYIGLEATQLNNTEFVTGSESSSELVDHFNFCAGYAFEVSERVDLKPAMLVRHVPGLKPDANVSVGAFWNELIWLGAGYQWNVGYLAYMQITLIEKLKVGYSYDYASTELGTAQQGSHEILLTYDLDVFKNELSSPRYF